MDHPDAYHQDARCTRRYCTSPWRWIGPLVTKSRVSAQVRESRLAESSTTIMREKKYYPAAAGHPLPVRCLRPRGTLT